MSASELESLGEAAAANRAQTEPDLVGRQVDKYRVLRILGRGGMGAVYEAVHEAIGQRIAIKVLKTELSSDSRHVQRFFDEARAVNIVRHPGLIKVYDFGHLPDGTAYITMEFLEGESLQERLSRFQKQNQRMDLVDVLRIARQIGSALEAVHAKGIAHRERLLPSRITDCFFRPVAKPRKNRRPRPAQLAPACPWPHRREMVSSRVVRLRDCYRTCSCVLPTMPLKRALILVTPGATPYTSPGGPPSSEKAATPVLELVHCT